MESVPVQAEQAQSNEYFADMSQLFQLGFVVLVSWHLSGLLHPASLGYIRSAKQEPMAG